MNYKRYDAKDSVVLVNGVHITGLAEDFWTFEKQEALSEMAVGAQGDVCESVINNSLYDATLTIQKSSPQRKYLRSLKDEKETFPIWHTNKPMGVKQGGTMARVIEVPSSEFGATAGDEEYKFVVIDGVDITE